MRSWMLPRGGRLVCLLIVLGAFGLLSAQEGNRASQSPTPTPQSRETNPPKPAAKDEPVVAAPVDPKTYKIGAEDMLNVRVWRENDLSGNVVVRPDGKITIPLAGEITAAGLTPELLSTKIAEALSKFLNKPEVIVSVMSVQSKRYYLSGNVGRSGPVPLVTPTTVLQALSAAGLGQWAKKNKIVIMRGAERIKFNYNEVIKGKKLEQNIYLQDGDHIYVP